MKIRRLLAAAAAVAAATGLVLVGDEGGASAAPAPSAVVVNSPSPTLPDAFPAATLAKVLPSGVLPAYTCGSRLCTNLFNLSLPAEGSHTIGAIHSWDLSYPLGKDTFCPNGCYDAVLRAKADTFTTFHWPNAGGWYMAHHFRARTWIFDRASQNYVRHGDQNAGIYQTPVGADEVIQVYPCGC